MSDYGVRIHFFQGVSGPTLRIVDETHPNAGAPHRPESFVHAAAELISGNSRFLFTTQTPQHVAVVVPDNVQTLSQLCNHFGGAKPQSWRYNRTLTQAGFRLLLERMLALTEGCPVPGTLAGIRRNTLSIHKDFRRNSVALAAFSAVGARSDELNDSAMRTVNLLGSEAETPMRVTVLRDACIPHDPVSYKIRAFSKLGTLTMSHAELLHRETKRPLGKTAGAGRWQYFRSFRPKADSLIGYLSRKNIDGKNVAEWIRA